jgi:hypothetical protein
MRRNRQGRVTTTPDFSDMSIALACMVAFGDESQGLWRWAGRPGLPSRMAASPARRGESYQ